MKQKNSRQVTLLLFWRIFWVVADVPESIINAVKLFILDNFFSYLIFEPSIEQLNISNKSAKWKGITTLEIKKFLGLIILMVQVHNNRINDYWSTDSLKETHFFQKIYQGIDFDKFQELSTLTIKKT